MFKKLSLLFSQNKKDKRKDKLNQNDPEKTTSAKETDDERMNKSVTFAPFINRVDKKAETNNQVNAFAIALFY